MPVRLTILQEDQEVIIEVASVEHTEVAKDKSEELIALVVNTEEDTVEVNSEVQTSLVESTEANVAAEAHTEVIDPGQISPASTEAVEKSERLT